MKGLRILGEDTSNIKFIRKINAPGIDKKNEQEFLKELDSLMDKIIIEECSDIKKACLLLSGGVDSALLAILLKKKVNLFCITSGAKGSRDILLAKKLAKTHKLNHKIVYITKDMIDKDLDNIMNFVGNSSAMQIGAAINEYFCIKEAKKKGFDTFFMGTGVDTLFAGLDFYNLGDVPGAKRYQKFWKELNFILEQERIIGKGFDTTRLNTLAQNMNVQIRLPFERSEWYYFVKKLPSKYLYEPKSNLGKIILRKYGVFKGISKKHCFTPKQGTQVGSNVYSVIEELAKKDQLNFCPDLGSNLLYGSDPVNPLVRYYLSLRYFLKNKK